MDGMNKRPALARLADLVFEAGMLRKTPRTGYQFLGSGSENVAEHSFRTALIGYILAVMSEANPERTAMLCLIHDFHEARTGDFNYVNSIYNSTNHRLAMEHALSGTCVAEPLMSLWDEQDKEESKESLLAKDADQIDLIFNLIEERDKGNAYADKWLENAVKRIESEAGKTLVEKALQTDHTDWWFKGPDENWWVHRGRK
ncbi:HD domain-containing protein [Desulfovibrio sp. OttesenSCG-928-G15]|nr:HD domain-containing protein [Desulfovibrio sp. OttesenSCG-928-G15]